MAGTDGERIAEVIPEDDPAVLLRLPDGVSTAEAAEEIFSAREGNDITDTRVYGLSRRPRRSTIRALHTDYPGLFAGVGLTEGNVTTDHSVGIKNCTR